MHIQLTAVFEKAASGYVGFVEELPGTYTEGATMEEVRANLEEAVMMVLEANRALAEETLRGRNVAREPLLIVTTSLSRRVPFVPPDIRSENEM
jgi:predicted RNase H-like HicB family nuclease